MMTRILLVAAVLLGSISTARSEAPLDLEPDGREFVFENDGRGVGGLSFLSMPPGDAQQLIAVDSSRQAWLFGLKDRSVNKLFLSNAAPGVGEDDGDFKERVDCVASRQGVILLGGRWGNLNVFRRNRHGVYEMASKWRLRPDGIAGLYPLSEQSHCLVHCSDKSVMIVDVTKGTTIKEWSSKDRITHVAVDAIGKTIAIADERNVVRFIRGSDHSEIKQLDIGQLIGQAPSEYNHNVITMSPNGEVLYFLAQDGPLASIDWKQGRITSRVDPPDPDAIGRWDPSESIDVSPDGRYVATGNRTGFGLVFSSDRLQRLGRCDHESYTPHSCVGCVKWSPKGDLLATGGTDQKVILWKTEKLTK